MKNILLTFATLLFTVNTVQTAPIPIYKDGCEALYGKWILNLENDVCYKIEFLPDGVFKGNYNNYSCEDYFYLNGKYKFDYKSKTFIIYSNYNFSPGIEDTAGGKLYCNTIGSGYWNNVDEPVKFNMERCEND